MFFLRFRLNTRVSWWFGYINFWLMWDKVGYINWWWLAIWTTNKCIVWKLFLFCKIGLLETFFFFLPILEFMPTWICWVFMDFKTNINWDFYLESLLLFFVASEKFVLLKLIKTKPKCIVPCWQWSSCFCVMLNLTDGILEDTRTCWLCKILISTQLLLEVTVKTY